MKKTSISRKPLIFDEVSRFTPNKKNILSGLKFFGKKENIFATKGNWRAAFLATLVGLVILVFLTKAFSLQVISGGKYAQLADSNKTRNSIILAERGVIYSSDGQVLARNRPSFAIELNKSLCAKQCAQIIARINEFVSLDRTLVKDEMDSDKPIVILANNLDKGKFLLLETNLYQLPGVSVIVYPIRDYIYPQIFAHSIGYVSLDDKSLEPNIVGKTGIEESYDDYLSGIPGRVISEVDSTGKKYEQVSQEDALPGRDLSLYLNRDLSVAAYNELKKVVDDKKAVAGVVVAQDPNTGGILALVSYPGFDANKVSQGMSTGEFLKLINDPAKPFFNRAVSGAYPPGSTFKMITASAALSEGNIDRYTTIFDHGFIDVNGYRFNNWNLSGQGEVDLVRALQVSNDTYFYTVGGGYGDVRGVGIDRLYVWAKRFGVGSISGVDFAGEVPGYMPDGKSRAWYLGDTYITSIGQGDVLMTPLQLNVVTSYFANGGILYKPQIVKNIVGVKSFEPKILAQGLITKKNYDIVREGLAKVVLSGGTAYPLFDFSAKHPGIVLGGKTGTSEYIGPDGKPATHAWFTVFNMTANSRPIALTVFLESGGAGSDDAAPIARRLLDRWFKAN